MASCASAPDGDSSATGTSSEAVTGAVGDWTGFTAGQCVHGVYAFYKYRYGITLEGTCAHATVGNCESCGACMIWEGPNVEPPASLFNKYAWGTTTPKTYDIVVYPPVSAAVGPGHVACVDHMTSSNPAAWEDLYVMDSNYYGNDAVATAVHTVSRAPYGIFRLKSLDVAPPPDAAPHGNLDAASCTSISGWAQDPTAPNAAIFADLYFDAPIGAATAIDLRLTAGLTRPDLCVPLRGSCAHGFATSTPRGTMDGAAHSVYAYGVDTGAGADPLLANAPKSITCTAPAIPPTAIKRELPDAPALKNWAFNTFVDMAPYTTAELAAVNDGAALDETPKLVQVAGTGDTFIVDGTEKRHVVDGASFAAWRFTTADVKPISEIDLAALTKGVDWPLTPLLVKDPKADTGYFLDSTVDAIPPSAIATDAGAATPGDEVGALSNGDAPSDSSGSCTASPKSSEEGAWLLIPFAALAFVRRRRASK